MRVCFISEAQSTHTMDEQHGTGFEIHLIPSSEADIRGIRIRQMSIYSVVILELFVNSI